MQSMVDMEGILAVVATEDIQGMVVMVEGIAATVAVVVVITEEVAGVALMLVRRLQSMHKLKLNLTTKALYISCKLRCENQFSVLYVLYKIINKSGL